MEHKDDTKETRKITNKLLDKCRKSTNITFLRDGGVEIQGKWDIPNTMNRYFCSLGEELAENIDENPNPLLRGDYTM